MLEIKNTIVNNPQSQRKNYKGIQKVFELSGNDNTGYKTL